MDVSREIRTGEKSRTVAADVGGPATPPLSRPRPTTTARTGSRNSTTAAPAKMRRGSVCMPWRGRSGLAASPCQCHCWVLPCLHPYHHVFGVALGDGCVSREDWIWQMSPRRRQLDMCRIGTFAWRTHRPGEEFPTHYLFFWDCEQ
jgi:hypothetical protein